MYKIDFLLMDIGKKKKLIGILTVMIILSVLLVFAFRIKVPPKYDNSTIELYTAKDVDIKRASTLNLELQWNHMPLTYKIINPEICLGEEIEEVKTAFKILENLTDNYVEFVEASDITDLELVCINRGAPKHLEGVLECKNYTFDYYKDNLLVYEEEILSRFSQELKSVKLINRSQEETIYEICYVYGNYNPMGVAAAEIMPEINQGEINYGKINLYLLGAGVKCINFPAREIQEILHSLGFDHNIKDDLANKLYLTASMGFDLPISKEEYDLLVSDIMFPYFNCAVQTEINEKYISCLKYIYSNGEVEGNCDEVRFLK